MSQIASAGQLRMSLVRWAAVTVPATVLLGFVSGKLSNSGYGNRWFDALIKPDLVPPGWVFGVVWTTLYVLMGVALAMILNARGAKARGTAIALFSVQFIMNLAWSPLFFYAHQVTLALVLIVALLIAVILTTFAFGRIRSLAAWLLVPYMVWLCLATIFNYQIDQRNPDAEALVPTRPGTEILL